MEQIGKYLHSNKTVDMSERAFEWVISWIAVNKNRFDENQPGEVWGKAEKDCVYVIKEILVEYLRKNGFEYNAVIRKWAESGHVEANKDGKFTRPIRFLEARPRV